MDEFDFETITDLGIRTEYKHLKLRAESIAQSVSRGYGAGRKPITFCFIDGYEFNAFAGEQDRAFSIELNASIPLFNMMLFSRLFSEANLLPYLDSTGSKVSAFSLPFVIDPAAFDRRADWKISLNEIRAFAASTIADICSTFVVCHEFGHIISGHAGARRSAGHKRGFAELVSRARTPQLKTDRLQAWEYDADIAAASLMIHYIEQLVADCAVNPRTRAVFSRADGHDFEHTLAIAIAGLFAFFTYVQGMRRTLDKDGSHPHPIVRAHYMKDALFQVSSQTKTFDHDLFHELLDQRFDEFMIGLEGVGLFESKAYSDAYMADIEAELERLHRLQREHRSSCAEWTWIEWG